jgi:hypothetical protein
MIADTALKTHSSSRRLASCRHRLNVVPVRAHVAPAAEEQGFVSVRAFRRAVSEWNRFYSRGPDLSQSAVLNAANGKGTSSLVPAKT